MVYDLGAGFRDPVITPMLALANEFILVTDSEIIPNTMLGDAIEYLDDLGVDLRRTTLVINHRLPTSDESAAAAHVRSSYQHLLRRVTEIPYNAEMSQLFNRSEFHVEDLHPNARLGVLTTAAVCLEGLREARAATRQSSGGASPEAEASEAAGARPSARGGARALTGEARPSEAPGEAERHTP